MDRSCATYEMFSWLWWGNIAVTDHLEDLDVDERIILKWIFKKQSSEAGWNDLAGFGDKWWLVNLARTLGFHKKGFFLTK